MSDATMKLCGSCKHLSVPPGLEPCRKCFEGYRRSGHHPNWELSPVFAAARDWTTAATEAADVCKWTLEGAGTWLGECGIMWELCEGDPATNGMNYCPRCGKRLEQQSETEGDDE